jgi:hypothetical protein
VIDLLANKTQSGELFVNLAIVHFRNHEWGQAKMAVDQALHKGGLSDHRRVLALLEEINDRLFGSGIGRC